MNTITFPMLNLKLQVEQVAFEIYGIEIYWYAILIVFAMILAICIFKKRDGLYNIKFLDIMDLIIYVIPIAIISARIYYVIFNLEYYVKSPVEIINLRTGGLAIYGGIIGGLITCIFFCKKRNIKVLDLLDYISPGLALGQAIGRWGNFVNIEAYGTETTLPWRMGIYELGEYIEVHPTFLYESIATFFLFIILISIKDKRKFEGQLTYTYLIWYGVARMLIEGIRTDSLMIGFIRISQLVSIVAIIIGIYLYIKNNKKYNILNVEKH